MNDTALKIHIDGRLALHASLQDADDDLRFRDMSDPEVEYGEETPFDRLIDVSAIEEALSARPETRLSCSVSLLEQATLAIERHDSGELVMVSPKSWWIALKDCTLSDILIETGLASNLHVSATENPFL